MKKLPIFLLIGILALAFVLSGCNREKTAAIYSCCDIGCTSSLPCSQYTCPPEYHYQSDVDQCVKNSGTSLLGQVCFPDNDACGNTLLTYKNDCNLKIYYPFFECNKVATYEYACTHYESSYFCKLAYWDSVTNGVYCDIDNVRFCETGCENGVCKGVVPNPDCSNGYMKCEGQDVYKCVSGAWQKQTTCSGTDTCEERAYNNAWCSPQWKYCLGQNAPNCVLCDVCPDIGGCKITEYATLDECKSKIMYYCLNADKTSCSAKSSCLSSEEQYFWANSNAGGQDKAKELCESQICGKENSKCCADKKCNFGLSCQPEEGMQDVYGNQAYHCVKSSDCEGMCADNAWLSLGGKVLVPNYMCIWSCQLAQYFIWLKIGLTVVAGLITMLTSLYFLRSKFPKKKDQTMVWVITLLLTGIMAALFYFYFIIWVIAFILYLIIMIVIKNIKPF